MEYDKDKKPMISGDLKLILRYLLYSVYVIFIIALVYLYPHGDLGYSILFGVIVTLPLVTGLYIIRERSSSKKSHNLKSILIIISWGLLLYLFGEIADSSLFGPEFVAGFAIILPLLNLKG